MTTTATLNTVFILFVVFQVKHFVADFPLQVRYMLRKHIPGWEFVFPLVLHCGVHALLTLIICLFTVPQLWWLAVADFVIHFAMDRIKAGPRYLGRYNDPRKSSYWAAFGFDQMVHHLTHIWIIWMLIRHW